MLNLGHLQLYLRGKTLCFRVVGLVVACFFTIPLHASEGQVGARVDLEAWQAYLVDEITPNLERIERPRPPQHAWVALDQTLVAPEFAKSWVRPSVAAAKSPIRLAWLESRWSLDNPPQTLLRASRARIEQSMMMPGVTTQVTDNSALTVSAVLAAQRFVNPGMNLVPYDGAIRVPATGNMWPNGQRTEASHGLGLRVTHRFEPVQDVAIETAFQSRIDMNPLVTLQGVHGTQAQLDIPSRFQARLGWQITERFIGSVGVGHIFYSEVGAFPSRAMPARFSALLGDSTSPEFAWRDLSVWSAGLGVELNPSLRAEIEYKNKAQPRPTSKALADALGSALSKHAWRLGLTQAFGASARLHLSAAYSPPEYVFGGHVLGVVSDELQQELEVQALWQVFF